MLRKILTAPFLPLYRWADARFNVTEIIEKNLTKKMVPSGMCLMACFGGLSFIACILQFASGIFMLFFYRPTPEGAFASVQYLRHQVPLGWFVQKVHTIGPDVLIGLILIHMARIFYKGIFHRPRELHWISGCVLFGVVFGFAFTGSMLPNHLEYWQTEGAATHDADERAANSDGITINGATQPPESASSNILTKLWYENRFLIVYVIHVAVLPLIMVAFLGMHFVMIRRTGIHEPL